ncbi:MAG: hypothetical protein QXS20_01420 [Candidatus Thorarchaeota archaeon]
MHTSSRLFILGLAVVCLICLSSSEVTGNDTVRPEISRWGIVGNARGGEAFLAWAVVWDESGVQNVTLMIQPSVSPLYSQPLGFNGTMYVSDVAPLAANQTYSLRILAFDMANNSATSYAIIIDRRTTSGAIDTTATMPVVVSSSLALAAVVITLSHLYDRKRPTSGSRDTNWGQPF